MILDKEKLISQLSFEGYTDIKVCPLPPSTETPEHTHEQYTVHIVLEGELIITWEGKTTIFGPEDRVEFKAGTTHKAKSKSGGSMITGIKEENSSPDLYTKL
ncbi:MAG: cupin domain-containing protein [Nanoarchaeota archaeon]